MVNKTSMQKIDTELIKKFLDHNITDEDSALTQVELSKQFGIHIRTFSRRSNELVKSGILSVKNVQHGKLIWKYYYVSFTGKYFYFNQLANNSEDVKSVSTYMKDFEHIKNNSKLFGSKSTSLFFDAIQDVQINYANDAKTEQYINENKITDEETIKAIRLEKFDVSFELQLFDGQNGRLKFSKYLFDLESAKQYVKDCVTTSYILTGMLYIKLLANSSKKQNDELKKAKNSKIFEKAININNDTIKQVTRDLVEIKRGIKSQKELVQIIKRIVAEFNSKSLNILD